MCVRFSLSTWGFFILVIKDFNYSLFLYSHTSQTVSQLSVDYLLLSVKILSP